MLKASNIFFVFLLVPSLGNLVLLVGPLPSLSANALWSTTSWLYSGHRNYVYLESRRLFFCSVLLLMGANEKKIKWKRKLLKKTKESAKAYIESRRYRISPSNAILHKRLSYILKDVHPG